jgi:uncharacterized cupin superfamily protein
MKQIIVEKLTESEISQRGIRNWPVWEKEVSRFDWEYEGEEQCLFLEGEVVVETANGSINIKQGDFVTFPDGLRCVWDIRKPVKKHYYFP